MEGWQVAWLIRYLIISMSLGSSILVIMTVIIGKLYRYTSCLMIFLMQICYAIVNINALTYTDRFTRQNSPFIDNMNPMTEEEPWKALCIIQSYLIHSCWMVKYHLKQTSFLLSVVLVTFEYWILANKLQGKIAWKKFLLIGCFVGPMIIHLLPLLYPTYGYGPNGFSIPNGDGWLDIYFFSGWRSSRTHHGDESGIIKQQMAYGLNFMLPLFLGLLYELYLLYHITRIQKIHRQQGIKLAPEHNEIMKLHRVPFSLFIILAVNMIIRLLPDLLRQLPQFLRYVILCWDFAFDLIPVLSSFQFFRFVKKTLEVPRLRFLGRKSSTSEEASLMGDTDNIQRGRVHRLPTFPSDQT